MISLRKAMEIYLKMRRSLGYKLRDHGYALDSFVSFMEKEKASYITTVLALRWAEQPADGNPARWAKLLSFVRNFAHYQSATDPRTEIPPIGLLPHSYQRKPPYIYTDKEIYRLMEAAKCLPSSTTLGRWTYPTIFGLLAVTGLRISEAVNLQCNDVDLDAGLLTIRLTKFRKSRLVPIHPSTCEALKRYARQRDRIHPHGFAFFVSEKGTPMTTYRIQRIFVKLSHQIGLRKPSDRFGPRLHDFRHRFAVKTIINCYRSGVDVGQRLPVLSTFL